MKLFGKEGLIAFGIVLVVVFACALINFYNNVHSDIIDYTLTGQAVASGRISILIITTNITNGSVFFAPGWNFISIQPQLMNYSIEEVLANISGQYEYILEWNGTSQDFNLWSKNGVKEFLEFNKNNSYFIFFTGSNTTISLSGARFGAYNITLLQGWEAPVWPYEYDANVSGEVFYNISFDYMLTWNRSDQEFMVYSISSSSPEFNSILAGDGYFIRTEGGVIKYVRT